MESINISTEDIKYQIEHYNEDMRHVIWAVAATLAVLTTLAVIARLWARKITKMKLGADDYTLLAALVRSSSWIQLKSSKLTLSQIVSYALLIDGFLSIDTLALGFTIRF